jgi:S-DNA-T family DNA segregation ATPase FtsK/SpoIIIE
MTDTVTEADVGTLHHLDDRRPQPVQLTKPQADTAPPAASTPTRPAWARATRRVRIVVTHDRTRAPPA